LYSVPNKGTFLSQIAGLLGWQVQKVGNTTDTVQHNTVIIGEEHLTALPDIVDFTDRVPSRLAQLGSNIRGILLLANAFSTRNDVNNRNASVFTSLRNYAYVRNFPNRRVIRIYIVRRQRRI
jgi:hypothetical protein